MAKKIRHLLDVNVLVAILDMDHVHHEPATAWFNTRGLQWAVSNLTELGVMRYMTNPKGKGFTMEEATALLAGLKRKTGYSYLSSDLDWQTLTRPFARRLHGYKQVTDAYLLGLAIHNGMSLATFDQALLHLAGDLCQHLLILEVKNR